MRDGKTFSVRSKPSTAVSVPDLEGVKVSKVVVIQKSVDEIFRALYHKGIVSFLFPVESVKHLGGRRFEWILKPVSGFEQNLEWRAEIIQDKPNKMISWKTLDPSDIASAGSIWLRELSHNKGTEVRVSLKYDIPNEFIQSAFEETYGISVKFFVIDGLKKFKAFMEAGEIATIRGQPQGGMVFSNTVQ